jgi:hypothetical protein
VTRTVDLSPRPLDLTRLPLRRRVPRPAVGELVATDPLLHPLREPEVTVEVDLTVPRPDAVAGRAALHCRYGLAGDRVASTAWAGGPVEVATYGTEHWQTELARAADVPVPADGPAPPDDEIDVPLDVLLASGEAVRTSRTDVLDELVRRAGTDDPAALRGQLVTVHTSAVGRLRATVATREDDTGRVGWVTWLLFGDGWRSLTPVRRDGRPTVHLESVTPLDLGAEVAALVTLARGRVGEP